jgi:hypothetical protein
MKLTALLALSGWQRDGDMTKPAMAAANEISPADAPSVNFVLEQRQRDHVALRLAIEHALSLATALVGADLARVRI